MKQHMVAGDGDGVRDLDRRSPACNVPASLWVWRASCDAVLATPCTPGGVPVT